MADVLPKIKLFVFIGLICLLINISICLTASAVTVQNANEFVNSQQASTATGGNYNDTVKGVLTAVGGSFLPFFDLLSLTRLPNLDTTFIRFAGVIMGVFGAIKLYLLTVIVLNMLPFFNI